MRIFRSEGDINTTFSIILFKPVINSFPGKGFGESGSAPAHEVDAATFQRLAEVSLVPELLEGKTEERTRLVAGSAAEALEPRGDHEADVVEERREEFVEGRVFVGEGDEVGRADEEGGKSGALGVREHRLQPVST